MQQWYNKASYADTMDCYTLNSAVPFFLYTKHSTSEQIKCVRLDFWTAIRSQSKQTARLQAKRQTGKSQVTNWPSHYCCFHSFGFTWSCQTLPCHAKSVAWTNRVISPGVCNVSNGFTVIWSFGQSRWSPYNKLTLSFSPRHIHQQYFGALLEPSPPSLTSREEE